MARPWLIAVAMWLAAGPCLAEGQLETAVKATYLYKFAPFVAWPESHDGPFQLCVVGRDPFGTVLDQAVAGQSLDGRPFQVVRLGTINRETDCGIAYIGGSPAQTVGQALETMRGAPVLTVTDAGQPAGVIQFAVADGRVRFAVDQDQAASGRLTISSKLLSLALSVKGGAS